MDARAGRRQVNSYCNYRNFTCIYDSYIYIYIHLGGGSLCVYFDMYDIWIYHIYKLYESFAAGKTRQKLAKNLDRLLRSWKGMI